jgi:hypothetical protein
MSGLEGPRDRLRAANPVPAEDAPPSDSPQAAALFERIAATSPENSRRRTWLVRRRAWLLLPAALLAGAAGYGIFHTVSQPLVVACYSQPSLSASRALVSAGDHDSIAACGVLWRAGGEFNPEGHAQIPPLAACVLDTEAIGVFPDTLGSGTCSALGLIPASGSGTGGEENLVILEVQEALADQLLSRCVGREDAVAIVEQELTSHGLNSWRVAADAPFTEQEPCASVAFDVPRQTISLVPVSDST